MTDRVECVVVGGGVVGLAVARALALGGHEVVVLEREQAIGTGVSSRNSEVIHAGLYYQPGSLKADLCVRGKALLYELAARQGFEARACGKLIVATETSQILALDHLMHKARANGVPVQRLTASEARLMESELSCIEALWSPTTGVVDSHGFMLALQGDLQRVGGWVALSSRLVAAAALPAGGWRLQVAVTGSNESMDLDAGWVVNAAGLDACAVAAMLLGSQSIHVPQPRFAKGSYYSLTRKAPFTRLVYPAPQDAWLGVHLTLDLGGQARFGPDLEWLEAASPDQLNYDVNPERAADFYAAVRRYWPALPDGALQPSYSGIRPKIHGPGEPAPDFRIDGPQVHGAAGVVNLLGIESPGLTSAMAIGEQVAQIIKKES